MKNIYIDPGHSSIDPGAVGYETEFVLAEKVSAYERDYLLANYKCKVRVCPPEIDSLAAICKDANNWGADVYHSSHFNAGGGDGFECFVHNRNRIGLGEIFAKHVAAAGQNLRSSDIAPGVKLNPGLYVLRNTDMPAILTEGAFVDNKKDIADWNEEEELKKLGIAYAKATAEHLDLEELTAPAPVYTLEQFVRDVQAATGSAVDGIAGEETIGNTPTISATKNRTHPVVCAVQKRLASLGYEEVGNIDGIAGQKFTSALVEFQDDNKCWVDGEATAKNKTWRRLLGME